MALLVVFILLPLCSHSLHYTGQRYRASQNHTYTRGKYSILFLLRSASSYSCLYDNSLSSCTYLNSLTSLNYFVSSSSCPPPYSKNPEFKSGLRCQLAFRWLFRSFLYFPQKYYGIVECGLKYAIASFHVFFHSPSQSSSHSGSYQALSNEQEYVIHSSFPSTSCFLVSCFFLSFRKYPSSNHLLLLPYSYFVIILLFVLLFLLPFLHVFSLRSTHFHLIHPI